MLAAVLLLLISLLLALSMLKALSVLKMPSVSWLLGIFMGGEHAGSTEHSSVQAFFGVSILQRQAYGTDVGATENRRLMI